MKVIGIVGAPRTRKNGWSISIGDYVEYSWEGTSDYVEQVFAQLRKHCTDCDYEVDGPVGVVRARFAGTTDAGGDEDQEVEITCTRNDVQKSIFEPGPDGYIPGLTTAQMRRIRAVIDSPDDDEAFTDWLATATPTEIDFMTLLQNGVEYRIVSQPVIKQVTTSRRETTWPSFNDAAGLIFSASKLLTLLREVPNFSIPGAPSAAPAGFFYGWRLAMPEYESSSNGHSAETLEFEFGLWPSLLFQYVP